MEMVEETSKPAAATAEIGMLLESGAPPFLLQPTPTSFLFSFNLGYLCTTFLLAIR